MSAVRVFYPRFDQAEVIRRLGERMAALNDVLPLLRVVLFGSYAQGNYTVASDVDLLVVYRGRFREDAFAIVKKVLAIQALEPHVYSEDEFEAARSRIQKMTEGGIGLFPQP